MKKVITIAFLFVCVSSSYATPYANYGNLEYWGGDQGAANKATLVIDFGNGNHYGFGYGWDGLATGWDMLSAVVSAGDLAETHFGEPDAGYGVMVTSLSYDGHTMVNSPNWPALPGDTWVVYWESTDGNAWMLADYGVSGNAVGDGGWNGWTVMDVDNDMWPGSPPVPEPATLVLLGMGGAMVMRCRRK